MPLPQQISLDYALVLPEGLAHFGIDNAALERLGLDHQARKGSVITKSCLGRSLFAGATLIYTLETWVKINSDPKHWKIFESDPNFL